MKTTFNTLKKYARRGQLTYQIKGSFDGMIDGFSDRRNNGLFKVATLKDLERFKTTTRNYLTVEDDGRIELSNCCYRVDFKVIEFGDEVEDLDTRLARVDDLLEGVA